MPVKVLSTWSECQKKNGFLGKWHFWSFGAKKIPNINRTIVLTRPNLTESGPKPDLGITFEFRSRSARETILKYKISSLTLTFDHMTFKINIRVHLLWRQPKIIIIHYFVYRQTIPTHRGNEFKRGLRKIIFMGYNLINLLAAMSSL